MKWFQYILGWELLLAVMVGCGNSPDSSSLTGTSSQRGSAAHEALVEIDSLMWLWPDSALTVMLKFTVSPEADSLGEFEGHYFQLLISELLYKNDYEQSNREELLKAVDYFDSIVAADGYKTDVRRYALRASAKNVQNIAFLDARTHYINGVGYYENDNVVQACKEYMKALEVMEEIFEEKDLVGHKARFMALAYTHLNSLFSDLYLHEQSIYFGQRSLSYYRKYDATPWHKAWVMNRIGSQYDMMNYIDSAWKYYMEGLSCLPDTDNITYRDLATHLAYLSYKKDNSKETALFQLQKLISLSESERECLSRHLTIGEVFFHEIMYDSAWIHLDKVFHETQSIASKKQAAEWQVEICKSQGRDTEIIEYANFLIPFANQEENQSAIKSQLTELYYAFRQKALERQHQQRTEKNIRLVITVTGGLLIIILAIALFYIKNKKKLNHIENKILVNDSSQTKAWNDYERFLNETLCQDIIHSIHGINIKRSATPSDYPQLILSDAQLQQLDFIVTQYFGSFESFLRQRGVKTNTALVNLCHLYLLGMDEKQAAILLNRDYSSIKWYEKKLKTIFETQESMASFLRNKALNS